MPAARTRPAQGAGPLILFSVLLQGCGGGGGGTPSTPSATATPPGSQAQTSVCCLAWASAGSQTTTAFRWASISQVAGPPAQRPWSECSESRATGTNPLATPISFTRSPVAQACKLLSTTAAESMAAIKEPVNQRSSRHRYCPMTSRSTRPRLVRERCSFTTRAPNQFRACCR